MATVEDLGKAVKAKYPGQYDDMADADLGVKVKAKYPGAYDDYTEKKSMSFGDQLESAAKNFWDQINLVSMGQGLWNTVTDIPGAIKAYQASQKRIYDRGVEAAKRGDTASVVAHALNYMLSGIPGVGSTLDDAQNLAESGDIGGSLGKVAGAATVALTPGKVLQAAPKLAAAAKAGGSDIGIGAAKVGAGMAASEVLPPQARGIGRWVMTYPGAKQISEGVGKGAQAYIKAGRSLPELPIDTSVPPRAEWNESPVPRANPPAWTGMPETGSPMGGLPPSLMNQAARRATTTTPETPQLPSGRAAGPIEPPPQLPPKPRIPLWNGIEPSAPPSIDASPVQTPLPSGRVPGSIANQVEGPVSSPPPGVDPTAWEKLPQAIKNAVSDAAAKKAAGIGYKPPPSPVNTEAIPTQSPLPPPVTPQAMFDAAYEPPEGATPAMSAPKEHYQNAARTVWGKAAARYLKINGATPEAVDAMQPEHWDSLASEAGLAKSSPGKIAKAVEEFKKLSPQPSTLPPPPQIEQ